ncbi:MAG TPA: esterase-like activity of phytase family protein [Allosphingosinicella sp.]|uniref:esterase-like activity of phytase family protein n=1 Tax=Allosphingosinicella sp. TaxID=2823234 RepID=UPI002EDB7D7D
MRLLTAFILLLSASCASVDTPQPMTVSARPVPLDRAVPDRTILGRLHYLGGVELDSADPRFGGFSSLKWRNGRLYTITDVGDWMTFRTIERQGRLEGLRVAALGDLHGPNGQLLEGTATGDSEAMVWDGSGWIVGFEHDHKILRYRSLGGPAEPMLDPQTLFGPLEKNQGAETLAVRGDSLFLCAERLASDGAPNCYLRRKGRFEPVNLPPPAGLDPKTAYPVDADWAADGTLYILMRSWSGGNDNRVALVTRSPLGDRRTLATFVPPVTVDNYEGLALREENGRTFLYIISDDNFGVYNDPAKPETWQRTLLMKFELIG